MMWRKVFASVLGLLTFAGIAFAGDLQEAIAAKKNGDFAKALELLQPLVEANDPTAEYYLGLMYVDGLGVGKSDGEAVAWYRKAATQGQADAQLDLGFMIFQGRGVEKSLELAAIWFQKAAEQGNLVALNNLGVMSRDGLGLPINNEEAFKWFSIAARGGYPDAQYNLAIMYLNGEAVEKNYAEYANWIRKAAEQGHSSAQNSLGWIYESGQEAEKNMSEAAVWYRKAAEQGNAVAQTNLGNMYENGQGVPKDFLQAFNLYQKATAQEYARGQYCLGLLFKSGNGTDQNFGQAVELFQKSAEQGYAPAQKELALQYETGEGVTQDYAEALNWYRKAAEQGDEIAQRSVPIIQKTLQVRLAHPNSPQLFGVSLVGAQRDEIRRALKGARLKALREEYNFFADKYDPSGAMRDADEMYVFYSSESDENGWGSTDYLAKVSYRFPSNMDTQQVAGIRDMVGSKYGNPDTSSGHSDVGEVSYIWKRDGVDIVVERGWPDTTTYLVYLVPEIKQAMDAELAALEKERKAEELKKSANAF